MRLWLILILTVCSGYASASSPDVARLVDDEQTMRNEVARFFELTQAINIDPIKNRVGVLINRKLRQNNSGMKQLHYQTVKTVVAQEIEVLSENQHFFDIYFKAYSKHFTLQELQEINQFFSSQAGKRFIETRTALHKDVSTSTVKMIHNLVDQIGPKVQQSLAKAGVDVDLD